MVWTATHSDLHLSGLTPAACRPDARALDGLDIIRGVFQVDGHGFDGGEPVRFSASNGGAVPSGIVPGTYYIVAATNGSPDFFSLAPLLQPTDSGRGTTYVSENYLPKIDRVMAQWTSVLVAKAVAYAPPWLTAPAWAPMMVAKLAAPTIAAVLRVSRDRYPVDEIKQGYEWAQQELRFLESGGIYNDGTGPIDSALNTGTAAAIRAKSQPPIGWERRRTL